MLAARVVHPAVSTTTDPPYYVQSHKKAISVLSFSTGAPGPVLYLPPSSILFGKLRGRPDITGRSALHCKHYDIKRQGYTRGNVCAYIQYYNSLRNVTPCSLVHPNRRFEAICSAFLPHRRATDIKFRPTGVHIRHGGRIYCHLPHERQRCTCAYLNITP